MDIETPVQIRKEAIRSKFEDLLRNNIRQLMDTMPEAASLPFDIVTMTSLILIVDRENEIQTFPESSPGRYSEEALIQDLIETGLEIDDTFKSPIDNLAQMGFVTINGEGVLVPRESTPKLVSVLDNLFPGMPGINLVAYFIQTMDEVVSGRKDFDKAIRQFEQTLQSRGVPLSMANQSSVIGEKPAGSAGRVTQRAEAEAQRRDAYMQRLREIRSKQTGYSADSAAVKTLTSRRTVEVRPLFPAPSPSPESQGEPVNISSESKPVPGSDPPEPRDESDRDPTGDAAREMQPDESRTESFQPDDAESETFQRQEFSADPATDDDTEDPITGPAEPFDDASESKDAPLSAPPDPDSEHDPMPIDAAPPETDPVSMEEAVDEKIAAFQKYLAMTCPYCKTGKVRAAETEKGKVYYSCENTECNFISWGKPYHFSCPYCQNPFLVEFNTHDGINGLKCPKATCNYRQDDLESPHAQMGPSSPVSAQTVPEPVGAPTKKRKKLVRKRLVRRKR